MVGASCAHLTLMSQTRRQTCSAWALWCVLILVPLAGWTAGFPEYLVSTFTMNDGLPLNQISAVVQTSDGFLWVATRNGLARFDGVRFTIFDATAVPELRNNLITALFEDRAGRLWIGHETGEITVFYDGQFHAAATGSEWRNAPVQSFVQAADGTVWVLNRLGWLLPFHDGHAGSLVRSDSGMPIDGILIDRQGNVWLTRDGTFAQLKNSTVTKPANVPPPTPGASAVFPGRKGGLWILDDHRLRRWLDGKWAEDRNVNRSRKSAKSILFETRGGQLLVEAEDQNLEVIETDGSTERLGGQDGLPPGRVSCIWEDREGDVWIGASDGLSVLRPRRVTMLNPPDHWLNHGVLSVATNAGGGLWIGTDGAGVYQFDWKKFTRLDESNGLPAPATPAVCEDAAGKLWIGTQGAGLSYFAGGKINPAVGDARLQANVLALLPIAANELWVGTESGPARFANGNWIWVAKELGLNISNIRCLAQTGDGAIWLGSLGEGLARVAGGQVKTFRQVDGLASDYIWSLHVDREGTLWAGTYGAGLSRFKDGKFTSLSTAQGLPSDVICCMLEDDQDNFWISSYAGIFRVARTELNRYADGQAKSVSCLLYDTTHGLATLEMSGGCQPAGCRTADGRLCFATSRGIAVVNPAEVRINPLPPPVEIEEVLVDGVSRKPGESAAATNAPPRLTVAPGKHRFEFRYTGLSFSGPQNVRFKYQLEGFDQDWFEAGTRRFAFYSLIPPGDYRFHVIACNSDGVWNATGAALAVTVRPYLWQTGWFKILSVLCLLLLVGGGILLLERRRHRRQLQAVQTQQAVDRERMRIARDIHDDVGARLTQLLFLGKLAQRNSLNADELRGQVAQLTARTREVVGAMDEIVWAANPQNDTLANLASYLSARALESFEATGIRCRLKIMPDLPAVPLGIQTRHNLFMAVKEALNNATKHSAAREIWLGVSLDNEQLVIIVADDGQGFDVALSGSAGNGLQNLHKRLEEIGGHCEIESRPGQGCRVRLSLPMSSAE